MVLPANSSQHVLCYCNTCGKGSNGTCVSDYMCNVRHGIRGLVQDCVNRTQDVRKRIWCEKKLIVETICCNSTLCNAGGLVSSPSEIDRYSNWSVISVVVPFFVVMAIVAIALAMRRMKSSSRCTALTDGCRSQKSDDQQVLEDSTDSCSGSGRGSTKLMKRTIAKDIQNLEIIGTGRWSTVYRGLMHESEVALKVFTTKDGLASWTQEKHIYTHVPLKHENVLTFMVADLESYASCTRYLIVTHYHPNGSLYDYLGSRGCVKLDAAIHLLRTAASGLHYLHTEMLGRPHKVRLAHRDIKTKNILVKTDGACCISDFGLSITADDLSKEHGHLDGDTNDNTHLVKFLQVGTKRYLAPEILDTTIHSGSLTSFQAADVYSFGLVIWEVLANCGTALDGRATPGVNIASHDANIMTSSTDVSYFIPYADHVCSNPTFQQMEDIVSKRMIRPNIKFLSRSTVSSEVQQQLHQLMTSCWCPQPTARITSLRVCKRLVDVSQLFANQMDKEALM